jgi:hypothetical protein
MTTKAVAKRQAKARADDIRSRLDALAEHIETLPILVGEAWEQGDFEALGYATWEEYVKAEYGTHLLKLDRALRREWVKELTDRGMSTREIAPVVNASNATVHDDLRVQNLTGRSTSEAFERYLGETRTFVTMLVGFDWPEKDRKKLAAVFRQAADELEGK